MEIILNNGGCMDNLIIKIPHYGIWNTKHNCFMGCGDNALFWTTSIHVAREQLLRSQLSDLNPDVKCLEVKEIGEAVSISCKENRKK